MPRLWAGQGDIYSYAIKGTVDNCSCNVLLRLLSLEDIAEESNSKNVNAR